MIEKLEITAVHATVDDALRKYVTKKIGHLDKYMPRKHRESAHVEVRLKEARSKDKNQCTCEVTLHVPHDVIEVSETTLNMYAAVDIVEAKLKQQIIKHKEMHGGASLRRRLTARFLKKSLETKKSTAPIAERP